VECAKADKECASAPRQCFLDSVSSGHDVMAVIEAAPGAEDSAVIEMAAREHRIS
jgi:hypothetical protein